MLRVSKIIPKDKLFEFIEDPNVVKVEVSSSYNNLRDKTLCKIYVYLKISIFDVCSVVGNIKKEIKQTTGMTQSNWDYLHGFLGSSLQQGFVTTSDVVNLTRIEDEQGILFGIPKNWYKLILSYK